MTGIEGDGECAHINHDPGAENYDCASNGIFIVPEAHLLHHYDFRYNPDAIGLSKKNNDRAIQATKSRAGIACAEIADFKKIYGQKLKDVITQRCFESGQPNPYDQLDRAEQEMAAD